MKEIKIGVELRLKEKVDEKHSAAQVGSGALNVYSTPSMIALMEKTCMLSIASLLPDSKTTVGGMVNVRHHRPTAIGKEVECRCEVVAIKDQRVDFVVEVFEGEKLIGDGQHSRFIIDINSFMDRV